MFEFSSDDRFESRLPYGTFFVSRKTIYMIHK